MPNEPRIQTSVVDSSGQSLEELPDGYRPGVSNLSFNSAIG